MATDCIVTEGTDAVPIAEKTIEIMNWCIEHGVRIDEMTGGTFHTTFRCTAPPMPSFPFPLPVEIHVFSRANAVHAVNLSGGRQKGIPQAREMQDSDSVIPTLVGFWNGELPKMQSRKLEELTKGFGSTQDLAVFNEWQHTQAGKIAIERAGKDRKTGESPQI